MGIILTHFLLLLLLLSNTSKEPKISTNLGDVALSAGYLYD